MKTELTRLLPLILLVWMVTSCSQESLVVENQQGERLTANRSVAEAIDLANGLVSHSRSEKSKMVDESSIQVITNHNTRSNDADTLMYVVSYKDNEGFVIIAAPYNVTPIVALVDHGSYEDVANTTNTGFQTYLETAESYISNQLAVVSPQPITPFSKYDTIVSYVKTGPQINYIWGQEAPEGYYCPNGIPGCMPIALSYAMAYFEYPTSISLSYPEHDIDVQPLNWYEIKEHSYTAFSRNPSDLDSHLSFCDASRDAHLALARLLRQLGYIMFVHYGPDSTGGDYLDLFLRAESIFATKTRIRFDEETGFDGLYSRLKTGGIALMNGFRFAGSTLAGHAWVADGTMEVTTTINYYEYISYPIGSNQESGYVLTSSSSSTSQYIHYNWGMSGNCNGYFLRDVYATADAYRYDNTSGNTMNYNYSQYPKALYLK